MPRCPNCNRDYPHGTLACMDCAEMLLESVPEPARADTGPGSPSASAYQLAIVPRPISEIPAVIERHLELHVTHVDGTDFKEGEWVARVPLSFLTVPIRIGRRDMSQNPAVMPEIDLAGLLECFTPDHKYVVSRLHASMALEDGAVAPTLRQADLDHAVTWVRRTGHGRYEFANLRNGIKLQDRDEILLGIPNGRNVRIRVNFR